MTISVVVPVYNESGIATGLVGRLAALDAFEVLVIDGGSTDGTLDALSRLPEPPVHRYRSQPGRARQMNEGALRARGDILLFLHADTALPGDGLAHVRSGLARHPDRRWGRFDVRFDQGGPLLKTVARAMNLRSACTGICTGDQALFVYRADFLRLGGFAPVALMEDVELSKRLKHLSRPLRLRVPVTTSARRWRRRGTWRTIVLMWRLRWLYWRGVPTAILARRYHREP